MAKGYVGPGKVKVISGLILWLANYIVASKSIQTVKQFLKFNFASAFVYCVAFIYFGSVSIKSVMSVKSIGFAAESEQKV